VPLVIMGAPLGLARTHRQDGLGAAALQEDPTRREGEVADRQTRSIGISAYRLSASV
jgi:hypothetical protein